MIRVLAFLLLLTTSAFAQSQYQPHQVVGNPLSTKAPPKGVDVISPFILDATGLRCPTCFAGTAQPLTKVDDTNVTLTLGGAPTSALLQAVSATLGWQGQLAVSRGGTGGGTASGTLLDNITGWSGTGLINRTGAGAFSFVPLGTGVGTALGNNIGTAGAPVLFNGAGGTPASMVLTNATGLPLAGITGAGTGVLAALAVNVGSAGAPVLFNGAGGTPSSINLANGTSLPTTALTGVLQAAQSPAYTGDATKPSGSLATTLATVNSNVGTFGSTTQCTTFTVNAKGLITAASQAACASGSGNVSNVGTPVANQIAQWTGASTIQGVNIASLVLPGSAMAVTGTTTATVTPAFPYFNANLSAAQGVTTSTPTKINANTENLDSNSWYDNATNFRFTPLLAGKYRVHVSLGCGGTTVGQCLAYVYKNGSAYASNGPTAGTTQQFANIDIIVSMNGTTDFLEAIGLNVCTGTCQFLGGTAPILTWFEAQYVSP